MSYCNQFCRGAVNTNTGIGCQLTKTDPKNPKRQIPDPLKHNPKTIEGAINLIKNGGRGQICLNNEWKHLIIKEDSKLRLDKLKQSL